MSLGPRTGAVLVVISGLLSGLCVWAACAMIIDVIRIYS